jgi:alkanesulfonate monooxygenase SsuD/methylene tetrahydromethanopterin reductase-like flavin-dependent oxidoreductase (luciferase family)
VVADSEQEAEERLQEIWGGAPPERMRAMTIVGTVDQCVEGLRRYADLGVGDFLLGSMHPHDWQSIELVASTVAPAIKAAVAA